MAAIVVGPRESMAGGAADILEGTPPVGCFDSGDSLSGASTESVVGHHHERRGIAGLTRRSDPAPHPRSRGRELVSRWCPFGVPCPRTFGEVGTSLLVDLASSLVSVSVSVD